MFTRSLFETQDMIAQYRLLNEVSELVDAAVFRTRFAESLGAIDAANLKKAYALIESGTIARQDRARRIFVRDKVSSLFVAG